jgi:pilus assembly protein Flp/PilA
MNFKNKIMQFMRDEEGLTVVEYVVGAALLIAVLAVVFNNLGTNLQTKLDSAINSN